MKILQTPAAQRGLLLWIGFGLLASGVALFFSNRPASVSFSNDPIVLEEVSVILPTFSDPKKVDVNTASVEELQDLPGIGEALAGRIVAHRAEHGPFETLDDLAAVSGIGPRTIDGFRDRATVGTVEGSDDDPQ